MDVRCGRCSTEYDFDDALVSERGTTVKCTNCGHQFKVYPGGAASAPERWIVRKGSGRELVYTSLRDLQRAIAQKQVGPHDLLSRGGAQALRPLSAIAELEPFFQAQAPAAGTDPSQRTLLGMAPTQAVAREEAGYDPGAARAAPARSLPRHAGQREEFDVEPRTVPRSLTPERVYEPEPAPPTFGSQSGGYAGAPMPAPAAPSMDSGDGMGNAFRTYQDSFSDEPLPGPPRPRRTAALRWVVGVLLLAVVAFFGGTVGMRYFRSLKPTAAATAAPVENDRVKKLLEQGDVELARGDFESAKEKFDKASALAERDPAVLAALARLEAARADVHWLLLKLIDPANKTDLETASAELAGRLDRVKRATEAATAVAANDKTVLRARIDAARLSGDVQGARSLVGMLGTDSSQPETAYVLGALDLAEASPAFATAIDRLRTAAAAERGFGRARAALVYALATSGAIDAAKAELAKLESLGPPNALLARLRAYVDRSVAAAPSASGAIPPAALSALTAAPAPPPPPPGAPGGGEAVPRGTDFRRLLEDASTAKRGGDLGRAEALYKAARDQQPGNVEALSGLGDVARLRGDSATASAYYDQVLQLNPAYLPSLTALADLKWQAGDRTAAVALYKRVANQTDPGSPYGQKAAQRIAEAQGSSGAPAPAEPSQPKREEPAAPPPPPQSPPSSDSPGIDTSDLPGFK